MINIFYYLLFTMILISKKILNTEDGIDGRKNMMNSDNDINMIKIIDTIEINKKINYLKSDKISIFNKKDLIKNKPMQYNVFNGGLLNDWNFEL